MRRLRLVRPSLRYFNSFLKRIHDPKEPIEPVLGYLARAKANNEAGEYEYWLIDGDQCLGRTRIYLEAKGRKKASVSHISLFEVRDPEKEVDIERRLITLSVRKAIQLGLNPVLVTCNATHYRFRKFLEKSGGQFIRVVRERTSWHYGKVSVYSFSNNAVSGEPGELGVHIARSPEPEAFARPAVQR